MLRAMSLRAIFALSIASLSLSLLVLGQDTSVPQKAEQRKRVRVSQGVATGLLVRKISPKYPSEARKNKIQGMVMLNAVIGRQGDITDLSVISGHPLLAEAALEAVKQWKYRPYLLNGEPVEVETKILVNFTPSEFLSDER